MFGTCDPADIACQIDDFCMSALRSRVADTLFYESSQGAVREVLLADGQRV